MQQQWEDVFPDAVINTNLLNQNYHGQWVWQRKISAKKKKILFFWETRK